MDARRTVTGAMPEEPIRVYYDLGLEAARLGTIARLEEVRTRELLERLLPPAPARIIDVGGGPGAYALWLAERGYEVDLIDPVPMHVDQARQASRSAARPLSSAEVGDARSLPQPDASADAVLLLGPLYHLTERADRLAALSEARRVLRPGGIAAAAAISRFASALSGLHQGLLRERDFHAIVERDLVDGQHRNPGGPPEWFTTAYFHHPHELCPELEQAGFEHVDVLAVEGPADHLSDLADWLDDPARRETLMSLLRRLEREPTLLGASSHLLAHGHARARPV